MSEATALVLVDLQTGAFDSLRIRPGPVDSEYSSASPGRSRVAPQGSEPVVQKRTDAFEGTDLHARLQAIGARRILVAGIKTEHRVAATCRGALRLGYGVHLASGHSGGPTSHAAPLRSSPRKAPRSKRRE